MTYKQKCLQAIWQLVVSYENGSYSQNNCPLCPIYRKNDKSGWLLHCKGCPNYRRWWSLACTRFKTFDSNLLRLKFWRRVIPVLEKIPAKYFTPSSWQFKPFAFLEEIDQEIMEEYKNGKLR